MLYILITILSFLLLNSVVNKFFGHKKNIIRIVLVFLSIFFEIFNFIYKITLLRLNFLIALPIYWCAITNIIQILGLISKKQIFFRITTFMVIGPMFSLFFIPNISGISYILYVFFHSFVIFSTLFGIFNYFNNYDFMDSVKTLNFIFIYFIIFECIYSYIIFLIFEFRSSLFTTLFIFDNLFYNLFFIFVFGYLFLFIINFYFLDLLIKKNSQKK